MQQRMLIALALLMFMAPQGRASEPVKLRLHQGVVVGTLDGSVQSFKGISYAAPPIGPLRWALPQPPAAWSGERQATNFGPICMQSPPERLLDNEGGAGYMSEDCLTVNVWAPTHAARAPVMVWLHGGGNFFGSSASRYYDGSTFARDGIILVSLNYRLGIFGFMAFGKQANFGLWDQIAALRWVRDNIAAFGGDPGNVTLFGESAGGQDALALLTAAAARGLYHKMIIESGSVGWQALPSMSEALASAAKLSVALLPAGSAVTPEALRALPAQAVLSRSAEQSEAPWSPVIDGQLLTQAPMNAVGAAHAASVPLIIGTNSAEGSLLGVDAQSRSWLQKLSTADMTQLSQWYGVPSVDTGTLARMIFRDVYFAGPAHTVAMQLTHSGEPAYLYRFEYVLSILRARRAGAYHGSEIPFVFENWPSIRVSDDDLRIGRALHECWVSFARSGRPVCADAPGWVPFERGGQWMVFDEHPSSRPIEGEEALDLLQARFSD